ncbi:insulin-induced protein-domain-containing protein [Dipodascopsis uninucleata]
MQSSDDVIRPTPVRAFIGSSNSSEAGTPVLETPTSGMNSSDGPHKSQSIVSLSTSTLMGIFGSTLTDDTNRSETPDPNSLTRTQSSTSPNNGSYTDDILKLRSGGSGVEYGRRDLQGINAKKASPLSVRNAGNMPDLNAFTPVNIMVKLLFLCIFGVAYGYLAAQLHDDHFVTSSTLKIDPLGNFILSWGILGLINGSLLPFVDSVTPSKFGPGSQNTVAAMLAWRSIVRSVGILIGVSYGIRRLQWSSTLQGAIVLAVLNPILWVIMDGSFNGFVISSLTAVFGSFFFAWIYPSHLPQSDNWSEDYISVITWIASVFFCSSVCFGTIGRRLLGRKVEER